MNIEQNACIIELSEEYCYLVQGGSSDVSYYNSLGFSQPEIITMSNDIEKPNSGNLPQR